MSIYLGRCAELAAKVRALVVEIQAPVQLERAMRRAKIAAQAALRATRARMKRLMAVWRLYARGWKVFGWRRFAALKRSQQKGDVSNFTLRVKLDTSPLASLARKQEAKFFRRLEAPWKRVWPDKDQDWARIMGFATELPKLPGERVGSLGRPWS